MQHFSGIITNRNSGRDNARHFLINAIFTGGKNGVTNQTISDVCAYEGCELLRSRKAGYGMCRKHYQRKRAERAAICIVAGCIRSQQARGLCPMHRVRNKRLGYEAYAMLPVNDNYIAHSCSVEGCRKGGLYVKGLCRMHYLRQQRNGDPLAFAPGYGYGDTFEDRFWSRVNKDGSMHPTDITLGRCWEWQGWKNNHGYGMVYWNGKDALTHRVAWALAHNGKESELWNLHSCDNPPCCNPDHLREGTVQDNADDMVSRNRQALGDNKSNAVINSTIAREIKKLIQDGFTNSQIARKYMISDGVVNAVRKDKAWKHVTV